jgi:hypothetical protein
MQFEYFQGPEAEMAMLVGDRVCSLCGRGGQTFSLEFTICPELSESARGDKVGCVSCLKAGRFEFWHDTEVGLLDESGLKHVYRHNQEPPADFPQRSLVELRRTPQIVTWQQEIWLTHCRDFMIYQGTWEPADFYANDPDGDGRALFVQMTTEYSNLWDDSVGPSEPRLESWHATYYVFRCRQCGALRGNWDCD